MKRQAGVLSVLVWVASSTASAQYSAAQSAPCLSYEPQAATLSGYVRATMEYGPPNFGETPRRDQRIRVPVLRLSQAIDVCGDSTSDVNRQALRGVRAVQLIVPEGQGTPPYNRPVTVRGTLMRGHTGWHYTKLVMNVQAIQPGRAPRDTTARPRTEH